MPPTHALIRTSSENCGQFSRMPKRCSPWIGASLVAVLALGLQTDVLGVPWLAYLLWALAGASVLRTEL